MGGTKATKPAPRQGESSSIARDEKVHWKKSLCFRRRAAQHPKPHTAQKPKAKVPTSPTSKKWEIHTNCFLISLLTM